MKKQIILFLFASCFFLQAFSAVDLVMSNGGIVPNGMTRGTSYSITVYVSNIGSTSTTTSFYVNISINTSATYNGNQTYLTDIFVNGGIAAGQTKTLTTTITIPCSSTAGTRYILDGADATNLIAESNETNNNFNFPFLNRNLSTPLPNSPTNITQTSFQANWQTIPEATSYTLLVALNNTFTNILPGYNNLNVGNVTSRVVSGLNCNTNYYYRVQAVNSCGSSPAVTSEQIATTSACTCPTQTAPTANSASNQSQTGFRANWSAASGASGYRLDVSTSNTFSTFVSGYNNLNVGNSTLQDVTGLTCNTTYYYRVRAFNSCGNTSGNSSTITTSTTACTCPAQTAPTANTASNQSQTGFRANWSAASGASGYRLDVSTSNTFSTFVSGYNNLNVGNNTLQDVTGLTCNTTYYYRVRAVNSCGNTSGNSSTITAITTSCTCPAQTAPTANAASNQSQTGFRANWSAASGANGYRLDVSTTNTFSSFVSGYNNLNVGNNTLQDVTGLTCNTTYYYRVRAVNSCGNTSGNSSTITAITTSCTCPAQTAPTANAASNQSQTGFRANWSAASGASGYRIDVSTSNTFSTFVSGYNNFNVGNNTLEDFTGLTCNTTYYYRVKAYNSCGNTSVNSATISALTTSCTCPTQVAPTANAASNQSQTGFRANWSAASGASGYRLDVSTSNTFSTFVSGYNNFNVGNNTLEDVTGLTCNTTYYYRVRAFNSCGNTSGNSSTITTLTTSCTCPAQTAPTANAASNQSLTGFRANWSTASGASGYRIDVSTSNTFTTFVSGYNNLDVGNNTLRDVIGLTCNTTYYYRVKAYNSCGNTSTNSSSISLTTSTCTTAPSIITISNVIRNNSTFPNPKILWTGNTNQSPTTIKVCSDGSTATRISFTNNSGINSANIKFWIASDPFGNNSDLSGYFINYSTNGNIITAELAHPKYLPSSYKPFKSDQIRIVDINSPSLTIFSLPLEVYRSPLLMVHGLWGAYFTFETVDNYLETNNFYLPLLTVRANYEPSNDAFIYDNRYVVPSDINTLLTRARNNNISAGKVDVIAHSMGGLVARYYLQSNAYSQKQDIHKLITINTPHSGAPIANLLTNTTSVAADAARIVVEPLANQIFNGSIYNGAISDLAINSNALTYLNSSTLNNGVVPSHAIITSSQVINDNFWHLVFAAAAPTLSMSVNDYVSYLFYNQANDLVVSTSSQSGGLPLSARSTYPNIFHNGSYNNSFVLTEIVNALNINSSNTNYFTQNGFAPEVNNSHYRPTAPTEFNRIVSSVKINSPIQKENYNSGSIVPVDISTSNGINRIILEGITRFDNSNFIDTVFSSGIINYKIPNNAIGKLKFIAIGYSSNNLIDYDTVTININQTSPLESISFHSDTLFVQVNNTAAIPLTASFNSGNTINITALDGVQFQIADTSFAKYVTHSTIQGKRIGITTLNANYLGKSRQIPISVLPEDTTIKKGFTNNNGVTPNPVIQLIPSDSIKIYPNPNRGDFTAYMVLKEDEEVQIDIFNQIGQMIYSTKRKSINKTLRAFISIGSNTQNGIYYIKASVNSKTYTGKFIVLPDK